MQFSRVIQSFLFRDLISYLVPGFVAMLAIFLLAVPNGELTSVERSAKILGSFSTTIAALAVAYTTGYLLSTLAYILWDRWASWFPPSKLSGDLQLICLLRSDFGHAANKRQHQSERDRSNQLSNLFLNFVESRDRDFFTMNIERAQSMKNFEIGLAAALALWGVCLAQYGSQPHRLYWAGFAGFLAFYLFFFASRRLDREIDSVGAAAYLRLQAEPEGITAATADQVDTP